MLIKEISFLNLVSNWSCERLLYRLKKIFEGQKRRDRKVQSLIWNLFMSIMQWIKLKVVALVFGKIFRIYPIFVEVLGKKEKMLSR